jgi:hypothetical protein
MFYPFSAQSRLMSKYPQLVTAEYTRKNTISNYVKLQLYVQIFYFRFFEHLHLRLIELSINSDYSVTILKSYSYSRLNLYHKVSIDLELENFFLMQLTSLWDRFITINRALPVIQPNGDPNIFFQEKDPAAKSSPELHYNMGIVSPLSIPNRVTRCVSEKKSAKM